MLTTSAMPGSSPPVYSFDRRVVLSLARQLYDAAPREAPYRAQLGHLLAIAAGVCPPTEWDVQRCIDALPGGDCRAVELRRRWAARTARPEC